MEDLGRDRSPHDGADDLQRVPVGDVVGHARLLTSRPQEIFQSVGTRRPGAGLSLTEWHHDRFLLQDTSLVLFLLRM